MAKEEQAEAKVEEEETETEEEEEEEEEKESTMDERGREEYWAGTKKGCPKQNLHVLGVTFHQSTDKVTVKKGSMKTQRQNNRGGMVWLTPNEAKAVRAAIKAKVVTTSGRATIADAKGFGKDSSVRPLGDFVYLVRLADAVKKVGAHWRDEDPPAMSAK